MHARVSLSDTRRRIVAGLMFAQYGAQKLFGVLGGTRRELLSPMGVPVPAWPSRRTSTSATPSRHIDAMPPARNGDGEDAGPGPGRDGVCARLRA